jgi:hypothetical protein
MRYRKKPIVIEAVQWTGTNADEVLGFTLGRASVRDESFRRLQRLLTLKLNGGPMNLNPFSKPCSGRTAAS